MKIGIITFHAAMNYGSVLQAFALQEYLRSRGNDVRIIDFRSAARYLLAAFTMPSVLSAAFFVTGRKSGSWLRSSPPSEPLLPAV